ncbi:MAG TPA: VanZ family protein, partial [Thermomicrobiales bacterium]|nr:VanZ family protein [Thermomicrobiales bacterium]
FKARFDDLGRQEHDPALADEGLEWLAGLAEGGVGPVAIYEHPGRKRQRAAQVLGDLRRWRAVNDVLVGFSGAPGHQGMQPLGAYRGALQPVDRWDPAAADIGDAWDRLLGQGIDVWAAYAPSDFHDDRGSREAGGLGDYWPGEFSETWLYAPERSAAGALRALRAGTFFGSHGQIAREVELRVAAGGLPRAAVSGEAIEVPPGTELTVELSLLAAEVDWQGRPSRIDEIELIGITSEGARTLASCPPEARGRTRLTALETPSEGIVLRARGRRIVEDGPDLMFYTNPVRVETIGGGASGRSGSFAAASPHRSAASHAASATVPGDLPSARGLDRSLFRFLFRPDALVNVGGLPILVGVLLLLAGPQRGATANGQATGTTDAGARVAARSALPAPRRGQYLFAWSGFAAFAVYGSWVPLNFRPLPWAEAVARFREIPFLHLSIGSRADWVANILLFVPIGFCGLAALTCDRRSRLGKTCAALAVMAFCTALSVSVEFSQLWFPGRTVSQNDIVAETIGGAAGIVIWLFVGARFTAWLRSFAVPGDRRRQFDWLLQAYLLGLVLYALFPLDLTISPAELWHKYREGKFRLVPFADVQFSVEGCFALASDGLLFVPVGMLAATALRGPGRAVRSILQSLLAGLAVAAGIELAQTFVYSRYVDVTELFTAALGILAGAAWRRRRLTRGDESTLSPAGRRGLLALQLIAFIAYAAFLGAYFVLPFEFIADAGRIQRRWQNFFGVPLAGLYWSSEYNALTQVLRKGLLFAPLGYWGVRMTALAQLRGGARLAGLAASLGVAIAMALGIECAQIWRDGTTANFTDVLLCTFGAAAALALTLRVEHARLAPVAAASAGAEAAAINRPAGRLPLAGAGWLLLAGGALLVGAGLSLAWGGAAWRGELRPTDAAAAVLPRPWSADPNATFTRLPADPLRPPELTPLELPAFPGAYAIWGATGRDQRGHIWLGVSAAGVDRPSAHLLEFDPASGAIVDRGDALDQLGRAGLLRPGEGQMKIHSKIVEAADGALYFASMDEQGESDSARRLPRWGSHCWRLRPGNDAWEHLFAAPEGLIAVAACGAQVYALGYFDHVLYQYDCDNGRVRSVRVGAAGAHISRNFFCDARGHVYVPRVKEAVADHETFRTTLVEFDAALAELAETPLAHYLPAGDLSSHGILGVQPLADGSIVFTTHVGFLYQVVPPSGNSLDRAAAEVRPLGWFHPRGEAYVSSLFTYDGLRYVLGAAEGKPFEWLVFDLDRRTSIASPLPETAASDGLLLYGSTTRDDRGGFYLVGAKAAPSAPGRDKPAATSRPVALRLASPQ